MIKFRRSRFVIVFLLQIFCAAQLNSVGSTHSKFNSRWEPNSGNHSSNHIKYPSSQFSSYVKPRNRIVDPIGLSQQQAKPALDLIDIPFPPYEFNFHQKVGHYLAFWLALGQIKIMSHLDNYDEVVKEFENRLESLTYGFYRKLENDTKINLSNPNNYFNSLVKNATRNFLHRHGISLEGEVVAKVVTKKVVAQKLPGRLDIYVNKTATHPRSF